MAVKSNESGDTYLIPLLRKPDFGDASLNSAISLEEIGRCPRNLGIPVVDDPPDAPGLIVSRDDDGNRNCFHFLLLLLEVAAGRSLPALDGIAQVQETWSDLAVFELFPHRVGVSIDVA